MINVKRIYDKASRMDGSRVLVDRLWPRGISKSKARLALWMKDLAPSDALRRWFHADPEKRWGEFQKKYRAELRAKPRELKAQFSALPKPVTIVTGVKDIAHSHVPVLLAFLRGPRS